MDKVIVIDDCQDCKHMLNKMFRDEPFCSAESKVTLCKEAGVVEIPPNCPLEDFDTFAQAMNDMRPMYDEIQSTD